MVVVFGRMVVVVGGSRNSWSGGCAGLWVFGVVSVCVWVVESDGGGGCVMRPRKGEKVWCVLMVTQRKK